VLREAVHVVTVSRYTQSLLEQQYGLPSVRITVVSPGVDAHRFHPGVDGSRIRERWGLRGARVALTVGRLDATQRHKGQDRVIEAMPAVLRQVPQAHYVVVGHGDDAPRLRDLARRLGVAHRVTFAGAADERELPEFYAASNVYVMPSRHLPRGQGATFEGFGMVFLEAAAAGRPVIGGRTGGIADAVIDGGTGWLVDPERSEALAEAMVTLLGDSTRAQSLGRAGRERMLQEFSWPAVVTRFEDAVLGALPKAA
jgi:phosphatidylinositol alpha-1,6-mannosyltransferase